MTELTTNAPCLTSKQKESGNTGKNERKMNKENDIVVKLSDSDWTKLRGYSLAITASLREKLPGDWGLSDDDIQSTVYGAFIKILHSYRPGVMSPASYCWKYGEKAALQILIREYRRLKTQITLDDLENPCLDDDQEKHQYGTYKIEKYKPLDQHIDEQDAARRIQQIAEANGLGRLAELLREGLTERQMARELCQDQASIHRKIQKLRKLCSEAK